MADEADSGTGNTTTTATTTYIPEHSSTVNEDPDNDNEKVSASNSNYDSNDGSSPLLRCDRCDKFETHSHSLLLVHTVQCATSGTAASTPAKATATTSSSPTSLSATTTAAATATGSAAAAAAAAAAIATTSGTNKTAGAVALLNLNPKQDGGGEVDVSDNSMGSMANTENDKQQQNTRKLFECDVCNMKFSNGANMRRHKMRHTGVKPYECRVCQKRFFRKDHLAEHFTTHTKTLPYHCPICNRGFQRQIAMRAHFQNEHVGQHDLVKTCPLCSYRAGTMKSLRVHFFNRHGIDLDNPGPGAPSSLLLALDPQNTGQYLPSISAATTVVPTYSDSGDSIRSTDNATPPMHFLTPHVEISMAENIDSFNTETGVPKNSSLEIKPSNGPIGISPSSPQSVDSNSNVPSSSHTLSSLVQSPRSNQVESHITPSISLIPIKQEPSNEEFSDNKSNVSNSGDHLVNSTGVSNSSESVIPTSSLTSLIKVSPLKSLLREDLKRRICARASTRAARNLNNATNNYLTANSCNLSSIAGNSGGNGSNSGMTSLADITPCNLATTTSSNGVVCTSTGQESELSPLGRKKCLQCLFCGIEFPDQTLYFLHKGCHSESNPWKCNICGEQCNNVYEFNSHLLSKSHQ